MKTFKKILVLVLSLALVFTVVSCGGDNTPTVEYTAGISADELTLTLKVGEAPDLLQGLKAIDSKGQSVLDQVQVSTNAPLDENGLLKQSGTYLIRYVVEIGGEKYSFQRTLVVIFEIPETEELVVNGDFELGAVDPFTKSEFDNGSASLSVVKNGDNHELQVVINACSWQEASPRVETNAFTLVAGKNYKASFKARALEERTVYVQVGQLISAAPWFYQLGANYFDLTEEMKEFSFIFTAGDGMDLTQIQLLFGFGSVSKGKSAVTTCFLDDIKVEETDEQPVETPDDTEYADSNDLLGLTGLVKNDGEQAAQKDPGTFYVWYVQSSEWGCGPATTATYSLTDGVLSLNANLTAEHWWFATQLFLYSKPVEAAGKHTISFKLEANNEGVITINGKKVTLAVGVNDISVELDLAEKAPLFLSMQLGWEEQGEGENISHTYVGNHTLKLKEFAVDGKAASFGEVEVPQVLEGDVDLLVDGWYDNEEGAAYDYTFANGVLTFSKVGGGEWSVMGVKVAGANLTGYQKVQGVVKGPQGEQILFKLNDQQTAEYWLTCTGELQSFEYDLPAGFTFNAGTHTMVVFANPGVSGTGNPFEIHELKVIEGEKQEQEILEGDVDLLVDGWFDNEGGSAYTFEFESGVLSFRKHGGGEWSVMGIRIQGADFTGYEKVVAKVLGPQGEEMIIKLNDNGAVEKWVTCTGEIQEVEISIPASFTYNAANMTMVLFANPGKGGTNNTFEIHELKVIAKAEVIEEPLTGGTFELYLDGTDNYRNHIEGAGAWIWVKNASIGMTNEKLAKSSVQATCSLGVADAFLSDLNEGFVRCYVVMQSAPGAEDETTIELSINVDGAVFTGTIEFLGTELK